MEIKLEEFRDNIITFHNLKNVNVKFTFYYDETNNIRRFLCKPEKGILNADYKNSFVLGGVCYYGEYPNANIEELFENLNLQKSIKELKFKYLSKGDFFDCMGSHKIKILLDWILKSDLYIHFQAINVLYFSIVDIIDASFTSNEELNSKYWIENYEKLKSQLYEVLSYSIEETTKLFLEFKYPNVGLENQSLFLNKLIIKIEEHICLTKNVDYQLLNSYLEILREESDLVFLDNEMDNVLISSFYLFYIKLYSIFINSTHIFDNESEVKEKLSKIQFFFMGQLHKEMIFLESHSSKYIQLSDCVVGIIGKFFTLIQSFDVETIKVCFTNMNNAQKATFDSLMKILGKSENFNKAFLNYIFPTIDYTKYTYLKHLYQKEYFKPTI